MKDLRIICIAAYDDKHPEGIKKAIGSLVSTARGKIDFYFGLDSHEPWSELEKFCASTNSAYGYCVTKKDGAGAALPLNEALSYICGHGELFVVFADDTVMLTEGWDEILKGYARAYGGPRIFYFDDGVKNGALVCHPVFTREWIETLGYAVPTTTKHYYSDTWVERIARLAGALHYISGVVMKHEYQGKKVNRDIEAYLARDRAAYLAGMDKMNMDAERIKNALEKRRVLAMDGKAGNP